ncbi:MAG: hypothetical protein K8T91_21085 [Planctomycetes bacterium]|nr:hypothetical protein [Planctomycetota bacterium]
MNSRFISFHCDRNALVVLTSLALLGLLAADSSGATITVTSLADDLTVDGLVTLREAINAANTDTSVDGSTSGSGADTIVFNASLFTGGPQTTTLLFANRQNVTSGGAGAIDWFGPTAFRVTTPITIQGPTGANGLKLTAQQSGAANSVLLTQRIFTVGATAPSTGNLTLNNLTLDNGVAWGGNGNRTLSGASNGLGSGGALGAGGAIFSNGELTLNGVTLTNNLANGGAGIQRGNSTNAAGNGGGGMGASAAAGSGTAAGSAGGGPNGGTAGSPPANGGIGGGGGGGLNQTNRGATGGFGGGGSASGRNAGAGVLSGTGGFGAGAGQPSINNSATTLTSAFAGGSSTYNSVNAASSANPGNGFSGSGAGLGGAIFMLGGTASITNSTFTNNTARGGSDSTSNDAFNNGAGLGGSIFNADGTLNLVNSTLSSNIAAQGGTDLYAFSGVITLNAVTNSTLASTSASVNLLNNILGQASSAITNYAKTGTVVETGLTNIIRNNGGFTGGVFSNADPLLGALADNGGPTDTMLPGLGSPAIDNGTLAGSPSTDQRGLARTAPIEIGAVEIVAEIAVPEPTTLTLMALASAFGLFCLANSSGEKRRRT